MSDPMPPNPAMVEHPTRCKSGIERGPLSEQEVTPPSAAELLSLFRRVEGWIDGDLLLAEEGGALLAEIAAAGRARDAGDPAAVRRHTARFVRTLEMLIESRELD